MAHGWIINQNALHSACVSREYECLCRPFRGGCGCLGKTVCVCGVWVSTRCWVLRKRLISAGDREIVLVAGVWWFSWCCPSLGDPDGLFGGGVGVLFENCIVDASIFVVFKNFTGFCVSF